MIDLLEKPFIGAYLAPPFEKFQLGVKKMKEVGINVAFSYYDGVNSQRENVIKELELSEFENFKLLVKDECFYKDKFDKIAFAENYQSLKKYDSFLGYIYYDEPPAKAFELLKNNLAYFEKFTKNKFALVNLQPIYSTPYFLENGMWSEAVPSSMTYEKYLESYINIANPQYLCFDFYPFTQNLGEIKRDYFKQLEIMSKLANDNSIPLLAYVQSASWNFAEARIPTPSELLWNVNTLLSYGVIGLCYFFFYSPLSKTGEPQSLGIVDSDCNFTALANGVRRANDVLYSQFDVLKNKRIWTKLSGEQDDLEIFGDCLIAKFENSERLSYFIVNLSLEDKLQTIACNLPLNFIGNYIILNGKETKCVNRALSLDMSGGESVMITLEKNYENFKN